MIPSPSTPPSSAARGGGRGQRIRTAVRMRPPTSREKKLSSSNNKSSLASAWQIDDETKAVYRTSPPPSSSSSDGNNNNNNNGNSNARDNSNPTGGGKTFEFPGSSLFGESSTNRQLYDGVVAPMVSDVLRGDGTDRTFCAYGQAGSGKTHAMQGKGRIDDAGISFERDGGGVLHMAARDVFRWRRDGGEDGDDDRDHRRRSVAVSCVELFNEEATDLLLSPTDDTASNSKKIGDSRPATPYGPLRIQSDGLHLNTAAAASQRVRIVDSTLVGAREREAESYEHLIRILAEGERNRRSDGRSSRSHAFYILTVRASPASSSTLTLVDLAGFEDARNNNAADATKKKKKGGIGSLESVLAKGARKDDSGGRIKESLLAFSRVVNCLGNAAGGDKPPFRESKLTQLLRPALLGDAGTLAVLFCIAPGEACSDETVSTLKFAERATKATDRLSAGGKKALLLKGSSNRSPAVDSAIVASARKKIGRAADGDNINNNNNNNNNISRQKLPRMIATTPMKIAMPPKNNNNNGATPMKISPSKRRSMLAAPSPYKRHPRAAPSPRRASANAPSTATTTTATTTTPLLVASSGSGAEKSAEILRLEARLREAERELEIREREAASLRSINRELEARMSSYPAGMGGGENKECCPTPETQKTTTVGDCSGMDTIASSESSFRGAAGAQHGVDPADEKGAGDKIKLGERSERPAPQSREGEDEDDPTKASLTSALDRVESIWTNIQTPNVETPNAGITPRGEDASAIDERASLMSGRKAINFDAGYATFGGPSNPGCVGPVATSEGKGEESHDAERKGVQNHPLGRHVSEHQRRSCKKGGLLDERFDRILDLVGAAMDIAGETH